MMDEVAHWKHVWQCSEVLGKFISAHHNLFRNTVILELGSGCTGIPGLLASKCGAKFVFFTDHPSNKEAFDLLEKNCTENQLDKNSYAIKGLDWNHPEWDFLDSCGTVDYIFAADVFYDPSVFKAAVATIANILHKNPGSICIFTYEERDSSWSIEDLLVLNGVCSRRIRLVDTDMHTIHIGLIYTLSGIYFRSYAEAGLKMFAGIEGGATQSKMVIIDKYGRVYGEWLAGGMNYCLDGLDVVADRLADWVERAKDEVGIRVPLAAVGMGLSGAEDEISNQRFVDFLKNQHGDVSVDYLVTSDSVMAIAATFEKGGVVLVAGTGSSCRLLKADGTTHGVGGWGHLIGDGGSGFWIAKKIIKCIFDDEDGLSGSPYPTTKAKQLMLDFFRLENKIGILEHLYTNFDKSKIASFAGVLIKEANDDPLIRHVFYKTGRMLGRHMRAISKHFDQDMLSNTPLLLIGSIWQSWSILKAGFIDELKRSSCEIKQITLHLPRETPAIGAAMLAAKKMKSSIKLEQQHEIVEVITLR